MAAAMISSKHPEQRRVRAAGRWCVRGCGRLLNLLHLLLHLLSSLRHVPCVTPLDLRSEQRSSLAAAECPWLEDGSGMDGQGPMHVQYTGGSLLRIMAPRLCISAGDFDLHWRGTVSSTRPSAITQGNEQKTWPCSLTQSTPCSMLYPRRSTLAPTPLTHVNCTPNSFPGSFFRR